VRTSAKQYVGLLLGLALALAGSATALADVVPVVSVKSSVEHLSRKDLANIFLGRTANFPNGEEVVPIDQDEDSPARDEFYATFIGKTPAQLRAHWSKIIFTGRGKPPLSVPNGARVRKLLAANPHAIGYLDRKLLDHTVKVIRVE
jgi:ABC-type phosphate transport system substrate-binding protein